MKKKVKNVRRRWVYPRKLRMILADYVLSQSDLHWSEKAIADFCSNPSLDGMGFMYREVSETKALRILEAMDFLLEEK